MEIVNVDLSEVDSEDKSFYIPFKSIPADLISSIRSIGLINPPILLFKSKKLIILTGWKRIEVCKNLGINKIICKVIEENELSVKKMIKLIYEDNKNWFSDVETGQLASIFLKYESNIESFLELIGLPENERNIERFNHLCKVDLQIVDLYLEEKLNTDQVFILCQLNISDSMLLINRILIPYKLNANETREFIKEISDISSRDSISIGKILDNLLYMDDNNRKDRIRYSLKNLRYPGLSRAEDEFSDLVKKLKLPKHININHSPFFENNFIEIVARISKDSQLQELKDLLDPNIKYQILIDLLNLVRDGSRDS